MNKKISIAVAVIAAAIFFTVYINRPKEKILTEVPLPASSTPIAAAIGEVPLPTVNLKEISDIKVLESSIDQLTLGDKQSKIWQSLAQTLRGKRLARMLVLSSLYNYSPDISSILSKLQNEYKNDFLSNPNEVQEIVHQGLSDLDAENFPHERYALIGTLAGISSLTDEASSIALSELLSFAPQERILPFNATEEQQNIYYSTSDARYLYPTWMYQIYLDAVKDKELAKKETAEILAVQKDHQVAQIIKNMLAQKFKN